MRNKLLIITAKILHYRNDLFNEIGNQVELEVWHIGTIKGIDANYKVKNFTRVNYPKGFYSYKGFSENLKKMNPDKIICIFDIRCLNIYKFLGKKYHTKTYFWGIGMASAHGLKPNKILDKFRILIASRVQGLLLYSDYAKSHYISLGYKKELLVAHNSLKISNNASPELKDTNATNFLFVGSLSKRKRTDLFFKAFAAYKNKYPESKCNIFIIGDGEEKLHLQQIAEDLTIKDFVIFLGNITDQELLTSYYQKSILSFSINQAGLSVLQSLGNGVPFLSSEDAITGGELFNITPHKTGWLLPKSNEITKIKYIEEIISESISKKSKMIAMRENCYHYYKDNASLEKLAKTFTNIL